VSVFSAGYCSLPSSSCSIHHHHPLRLLLLLLLILLLLLVIHLLLLLLLLPKVLHLALSAVSGCGKSGETLADIHNSILEQAVLAFKKEGRLCCCWEEVEGRVKEEF
jgi:hypothetical protein